ncbi:ATP-sensitive inward rectifier potassium channel protein [Pseudoscourfieldia marina]
MADHSLPRHSTSLYQDAASAAESAAGDLMRMRMQQRQMQRQQQASGTDDSSSAQMLDEYARTSIAQGTQSSMLESPDSPVGIDVPHAVKGATSSSYGSGGGGDVDDADTARRSMSTVTFMEDPDEIITAAMLPRSTSALSPSPHPLQQQPSSYQRQQQQQQDRHNRKHWSFSRALGSVLRCRGDGGQDHNNSHNLSNDTNNYNANKPRLLYEEGRNRVKYVGVRKIELLLHDPFTSIVSAHWFRLILFVCLMYSVTWIVFALLWWVLLKAAPHCLYFSNNLGRTNNPQTTSSTIGSRDVISGEDLDVSRWPSWQRFNIMFVFSVATQQTIGYGDVGILSSQPSCGWASFLLWAQSLVGLLVDAIMLGLVFVRVSNPNQRARSICISDKCVIARSDGVLKLMFRIADLRAASSRSTLSEPKVRAYLFTWDSYATTEGELCPYRCQELNIGYDSGGEPGIQICLILPVKLEHVIDERSPLFGHTRSSLEALRAEIVVTFEGILSTTGGTFVLSQSYLAHEMMWNHVFATIVYPAGDAAALKHGENGRLRDVVDFSRFHHVYPCMGDKLSELISKKTTDKVLTRQPSSSSSSSRKASAAVGSEERGGSSSLSVVEERQQQHLWWLNSSKHSAIPPPLVREKTVIVSDFAVIHRRADGRRVFAFRVADVYRNQVLDARARALLYCFDRSSGSRSSTRLPGSASSSSLAGTVSSGGAEECYTETELDLGYSSGRDRLFLWLPSVAEHVIDESSPLFGLDEMDLVSLGAEVVVSVEGTCYATGNMVVTHKVYRAGTNLAFGATFAPVVVPPLQQAANCGASATARGKFIQQGENSPKKQVHHQGAIEIDYSKFHKLLKNACGDYK